MLKNLNKFIFLPLRMKLLCLEAWLFQLIVGLLLKVIPFKNIPGLFKNPSPSRPASQSPRLSVSQSPSLSVSQSLSLSVSSSPPRLQSIKSSIQYTSPFSPWKNKCLVQSLAARWMLSRRRIPSQLSLGVMYNSDRKMIAHAWISAGETEIVEKREEYIELYVF